MTQHNVMTWRERLGNSPHIIASGAVGEAMQAEINDLRAAIANTTQTSFAKCQQIPEMTYESHTKEVQDGEAAPGNQLTVTEICTIAHRKATRYSCTAKSSEVTYGFSESHIVDFVRAIGAERDRTKSRFS